MEPQTYVIIAGLCAVAISIISIISCAEINQNKKKI